MEELKEKSNYNEMKEYELLRWTKNKPNYACVFLTRDNNEYDLWQFIWINSDVKEDVVHYYLGWTDKDGEEWGDYEECNFKEYLVIDLLPTMEETHQKYIYDQENI